MMKSIKKLVETIHILSNINISNLKDYNNLNEDDKADLRCYLANMQNNMSEIEDLSSKFNLKYDGKYS